MNDPSQLEQQLLMATSRQNAGPGDEETDSLRQGYLALAELLQGQNYEVDEAALVAAVLSESPTRTRNTAQSEAWLAMLALAAAVLVMVSLAATQFAGRTPLARVQSTELPETSAPEDVEPLLAWDDHWDLRLEEARESAAVYRMATFTRLQATTWSASEALREIDAELSSIQ